MTTTNYYKSNFNKLKNQIDTAEKIKSRTIKLTIALFKQILRRNPIEDGAISGFSGQKSVPE